VLACLISPDTWAGITHGNFEGGVDEVTGVPNGWEFETVEDPPSTLVATVVVDQNGGADSSKFAKLETDPDIPSGGDSIGLLSQEVTVTGPILSFDYFVDLTATNPEGGDENDSTASLLVELGSEIVLAREGTLSEGWVTSFSHTIESASGTVELVITLTAERNTDATSIASAEARFDNFRFVPEPSSTIGLASVAATNVTSLSVCARNRLLTTSPVRLS
jgi:hypothetical protein